MHVGAAWERLIEKVGLTKKLQQLRMHSNTEGHEYRIVRDRSTADARTECILLQRERLFRRP